MTNTKPLITFLTLKQFSERNVFIPYQSLRQLVHHDKAFDNACVRRLGKRVLINEEKALKYIDSLSK